MGRKACPQSECDGLATPAGGDTREYEVDTQIEKPEAAGQFWSAQHFIPRANLDRSL